MLRPNFSSFFEILRAINSENKRYGKYIYKGRIFAVSAYNIDRLLIGYFIGSKDVGFYGLANSMATPIISMSAAMGSSVFKTLTNSSKIPFTILKANLAWVLLSFFLTNTLGYLIINFYLKEEYDDVLFLLLLTSVGYCVKALYQPYNAWIVGQGYGKEDQKMSYGMAAINLSGNIIFVPMLGVIGAALSSILASFYYLYASVYFVKRISNG